MWQGDLKRGLQTAVSQNKRRFIDTEAKIDLDLTYICDRMIAMALPCVDGAMYRNDIREVARFFSTRHYGSIGNSSFHLKTMRLLLWFSYLYCNHEHKHTFISELWEPTHRIYWKNWVCVLAVSTHSIYWKNWVCVLAVYQDISLSSTCARYVLMRRNMSFPHCIFNSHHDGDSRIMKKEEMEIMIPLFYITKFKSYHARTITPQRCQR
jgi:hypothetical protein